MPPGVPDPKRTERPPALVFVKPGQQVSEADIKAHLHDFAASGSKSGVPDRIVFVEVLPKTSVSKLDSRACVRTLPEDYQRRSMI